MSGLTQETPAIARDTARKVLCRFRNVNKSYDGKARVVADLDLDIHQGEFLTLLGPSGSGKTTTLMMLAGFEQPNHGTIELDGSSIVGVPAYQRNIGMVFQNYALFPHMTVAQNLAFPLRMRGIAKAERERRVSDILDMVRLPEVADRRPVQLSGGQQQRIALARALIFEPQLVLMDEPLGALDKQLREQMQLEIRSLHERLGITVVYVTHDQSEALTMSDRVAVFAHGRIQQIAPPNDIVRCRQKPGRRRIRSRLQWSGAAGGREVGAWDRRRGSGRIQAGERGDKSSHTASAEQVRCQDYRKDLSWRSPAIALPVDEWRSDNGEDFQQVPSLYMQNGVRNIFILVRNGLLCSPPTCRQGVENFKHTLDVAALVWYSLFN
jgi:ABC-type sulfate/molybdate transport systems ATPase subunit